MYLPCALRTAYAAIDSLHTPGCNVSLVAVMVVCRVMIEKKREKKIIYCSSPEPTT